MSAYEFILFAAGAACAWWLMAYQARAEGMHSDAVGSICEGVEGADLCGVRIEQGERLCLSCARIARAKELKQ